ncbi:hypothetical protein fHeYen901_252 [Yersinia phage fHe-Yen9-01]|uniref:Thymidylate synthase n=1 Tax=Yersinia phage fHe-Yen9-01 TaxID=1965363 RepID=A0A1V0DY05_9CAUD|nr:thymidylate synthase [Yersinia phage fHe-Yen9-01]ARB06025.1 hypothetical protein fHeYen901_252 [Yersinia phage fHe-Yen9-01]
MKQYQDLIRNILENGYETDDRTGTGTIAVFGTQLRFDLQKGFPAVTTKKLAWKACIAELLWFMSGSTNVNDLRFRTHGSYLDGKTIWDENYENQAKALGYSGGELGPVYGKQWRDFDGVDQLLEIIEKIKKNPTDRRLIVSSWNVSKIDKMALPPCHYGFQFNVSGSKLDLMFNMRSTDVFLGLPFNIASYAAMLEIVSKMVGLTPGILTYHGGNTHIYLNHIEQCQEVLRREPKELCSLKINWPSNFEHRSTKDQLNYILSMKHSDFVLNNYESYSSIKAPMAV